MFLVTTKGHSAPGNLALLSKSIGYSSSSLFCKTDCKVEKKKKKKKSAIFHDGGHKGISKRALFARE